MGKPTKCGEDDGISLGYTPILKFGERALSRDSKFLDSLPYFPSRCCVGFLIAFSCFTMRAVAHQVIRSSCLRSAGANNGMAGRRLLGPASRSGGIFALRNFSSTFNVQQRESSKGKNVIITGSSRGIGKSIALRLAADGYNVCVNDVAVNAQGGEEVAQEIRSMGRKACFAVADVTKRAEVVDMIQTCVKELGPLHTM
jgi:hypothetical protein